MRRYKLKRKRFAERVELPHELVVIKTEERRYIDSGGEAKVEYEITYLEPER